MSENEERPSKIRKVERTVQHDDQESITFGDKNGGVVPTSNDVGSDYDNMSLKSDDEGSQGAFSGISKVEHTQSQPMSKSQLKKLRKRQEWEDGKAYRKAKRKEKEKLKKAVKAEQRAEEKAAASIPGSKPPPPKQSYRRPALVPITFVLDCDFDELMTEKEIISLAAQLSRSYSDNKSAPFKAHLVVSSFSGQLRQRFETILANHHHGWKGVKFMDGDFVQAAEEADRVMRGIDGGRLLGALGPPQETIGPVAASTKDNGDGILETGNINDLINTGDHKFTDAPLPDEAINPYEGSLIVSEAPIITDISTQTDITKEVEDEGQDQATSDPLPPPSNSTSSAPSVVYLSSDSPNTLDVLSPYTTYIVGGIVDKNRHKGICYKRACERGIPTARLPIGEYMTMQSRTVLATNHVIEIMVRWLEDGDWGKAFLRVIPKRKEAKLKVKSEENMDNRGIDDESYSNVSKGSPSRSIPTTEANEASHSSAEGL